MIFQLWKYLALFASHDLLTAIFLLYVLLSFAVPSICSLQFIFPGSHFSEELSFEDVRAIEWVGSRLNVGGYLLVEARGLKNEICGLGEPVKGEPNAFIYEGHCRRFIDADKLAQQIQSQKMRVVYFAEQKGFAPFIDKGETFFRLMA